MKKIILMLLVTSLIACNSKDEFSEGYNINYRVYKQILFEQFTWLQKKPYLFKYIKNESENTGVPIYIICTIIDIESKGKNVISKRNKNGTYDFGICQVNQVHEPKNPYKLLNEKYNLKKACWYLQKSYIKSKGNLIDTCRYYNQGLNGKPQNYKNWSYPAKAISHYFALNKKIESMF